MIEFDFKRPTRKCSQTEQEIGPGHEFYSALVERADGGLTRLDFSIEGWQGPPEGSVGWWKSKIPELDRGRVYWAPNSVLIAAFEHALAHESQADMAYIMALVLIRKRAVQWKDSFNRDGKKIILIHDAKGKKDYEVVECDLMPEQAIRLQTELAEKLFTDQLEMDGETHDTPSAD